MAYAALVSLSQTIDKLQHDQDRYPISPHEKQQIMSIHERVVFLQAFLEGFPKKGSSLEGRIRDVANEAGDIIEYFIWEQIDQRQNNRSNFTLEPGSSEVSHPGGMCFDFRNLKKVTEEIESIAGEAMEIKNSIRSTDDDSCVDIISSSSSSRSIIAPPTSKDHMVGFEDDLLDIKGRLCGESNRLQVIPIFGMGGIGKTTLARNAYDDQLTVERFQIRAWVTVSQDYSAAQILSGLLVSVGAKRPKESKKVFEESKKVFEESNKFFEKSNKSFQESKKCSEESNKRFEKRYESKMAENIEKRDESKMAENIEKRDESKMAEDIYKSLKGRRYLIVMDDMWSTKAWDDVRRIFPDDRNGSRIVLTTRLAEVAAYPSSCSPLHEMRFMDTEQSWNLLRQKVFPRDNCPPELEDIGKTIARSCGGLPLGIVVIAGLLSTVSQTPASWEDIARNVNKVVATNNEKFAERVVSLSYNHLPHHLRPCFLYMGGFPEDYEIRVSRLVKLWVAEGLLKFQNGSKIHEEVAEEYLEDLVKRSLVLVTKRKSNGKIKSCNVHDLVRDWCMRKAVQEKFLLRAGHDIEVAQESTRNQRRIFFEEDCHLKFGEKIDATIHSILCIRGSPYPVVTFSVEHCRLLRVFEMDTLRTGLLELFHLRYLSTQLPTEVRANISKLENLQTLIIAPIHMRPFCIPSPIVLPSEIWRMPPLRHLVTSINCCLPDPAEGETFALENLQTLSVASFVCSERTVKMIPNLRKLVIHYVPSVFRGQHTREGKHHLENLVHLHHLEKLKLKVDPSFPFLEKRINPVFPMTLRKLTLVGWGLPWKDIGIVIGSLPYLEVLKLRQLACTGDKWETSEGEFRQLKFLLISRSCLQQWITESSHFPKLECLLLHFCWLLNEIPEGIGEISTLELIEIEGRNESLWNSAKRIQEEQQSWGNDSLQVRLRT